MKKIFRQTRTLILICLCFLIYGCLSTRLCSTTDFQLIIDEKVNSSTGEKILQFTPNKTCKIMDCYYYLDNIKKDAPEGTIAITSKKIVVCVILECSDEVTLRSFKIKKQFGNISIKEIDWFTLDAEYGRSTTGHPLD